MFFKGWVEIYKRIEENLPNKTLVYTWIPNRQSNMNIFTNKTLLKKKISEIRNSSIDKARTPTIKTSLLTYPNKTKYRPKSFLIKLCAVHSGYFYVVGTLEKRSEL